METSLEGQKEQLMREGYVIVRDIIPPDELERLRESVDTIIDKSPPSSRVKVTEWVDKQTANAVEFYFGDRTLDFSRRLMDAPDAAPLGMWVLCHSGTGWHRDLHPIDMAPLDGLQEDIRLNGPPYLQWNLALYDDSYLHIIPRSHLRRNNEAESKKERRMGVVPLPGEITVDLKAGDGLVYINGILHSATPNNDEKRRTLHFGYQSFGAEGFAHFFLPDTMGVDFVEHLSPRATEMCHHFESLHAKRHNDIAFTLRAILEKDAHAFTEGLHRIHRSEHARMTTLVVLSKIACMIRKYQDSDPEESSDSPCIQRMADRFTLDELEQLWQRFAVLDRKLQSDTKQYEPLFQSGPMTYFFYEMPQDFSVDDFIASWN
jgi:hypothetical protein